MSVRITKYNNSIPDRYRGPYGHLQRQADEAAMAGVPAHLRPSNALSQMNGMAPNGAQNSAYYGGPVQTGLPQGTQPIAVQQQASQAPLPGMPQYGLGGANNNINQGTQNALMALDGGLKYTEGLLGGAQQQARGDLLAGYEAAADAMNQGSQNAIGSYQDYGNQANAFLTQGLEDGNAAATQAAREAQAALANSGDIARGDINNALGQMTGAELAGLLGSTNALAGTTAAADSLLQGGEDQARADLANALGGATGLRMSGLYGVEGDPSRPGSLGYMEGGVSNANAAIREFTDLAASAGRGMGTGVSSGNSYLKPFIRRGNEAGDMMLDLLKPGGAEAFEGTPGYQFALEEQERALLRNQAATGLLGSGNTLKELQRNANGLAAQDFGNHIDRLNLIADRGGNSAATASQNAVRASIASANLRSQKAGLLAGIYGNAGSQISNNFMRGGEIGSSLIDGTYNRAADDVMNVGGNLANIGVGITGQRSSNLTDLGGNLSSLMTGAASRIGDAAMDAGSSLGSIATGTGGAIANSATNLGSTLNTNFNNFGTSAANNAMNTGNNIAGAQMNAGNNIAGLYANAGQNLANMGTSLASQQAGYGNAAANQGADMLYGAGMATGQNAMNAGNNIAANIQQGTNNLANLQLGMGDNLSNIIGQGGQNLANLQFQGGQQLAGVPQNQAQLIADLYGQAGNNAYGNGLGNTTNNPGMIGNIGNALGGLGSFMGAL